MSIPYSWLPNSLFLLDTGCFFCRTTSSRTCQRTFLPGFHRFSECAWFTWLSTETLFLSESADFLSLLDMCWPVFLVLLVCVCVFFWCHGVHRETNRQSRELSETVPAHTRTHAQAEITRTRLSCGGDADTLSLCIHICIHRHTVMHVCLFAFLSIPYSWLPNSDSLLFSYNHTYQHAYVCVCIYIFVLSSFVLLSIPCSCLPDSLFLFDTGSFICRTTSCRTCQRTFLPGFHRFSECACFSRLSTETLLE